MFEVLIESRAQSQRLRNATYVSLVVHAMFVAGLAVVAGNVIVHGPIMIDEFPIKHAPTWVDPGLPRIPDSALDLSGPTCDCALFGHILLPALVIGAGQGLTKADGPRLRSLYFERLAALLEWEYPRYPRALRLAGVSGQVIVQFVIDTTGRIDDESVSVLESTDPRFESAVRAVLPQLRFTPAEIANEKVASVARMPFVFRSTKAKGPPVFPGILAA